MNNWKTTLAGAIGAAVLLINKYTGIDLPEEAVIALAIFAIALFSKDSDTTGIGSNAIKESDIYKKNKHSL